jgi:hypothetical protein
LERRLRTGWSEATAAPQDEELGGASSWSPNQQRFHVRLLLHEHNVLLSELQPV